MENKKEEALMCIKKQKLICFMLTVFVFLSGIYFENIHTDFSVVCASNEKNDSFLTTYDAVIVATEHCTTEMMGIRNNMGMQQLTSRYIGQKRDHRLSFDLLCSDIFCLSEGRSFTRFEKIYFLKQYKDECVLNYIHKSDGKKRI